jgi:hypothetical protein
LVELVLVALSASAYHVAETSPADIQQELAARRRILRQHDIVNIVVPSHLPNGSGSGPQRHDLQYRVVMLQPVAQGYVIEGKTKVVVIPNQLHEAPIEPNCHNFDELMTPSEDSNSEINENFLIHSVLGELGTEASLARSATAGDLGDHHPVNAKFSAQPLAMAFLDSIHHGAYADQDGFIRTAELARIGIFSGDWVRYPWEWKDMFLIVVCHRLSSPPDISLLQRDYCTSTPTTRSVLCEFLVVQKWSIF